jgi:hypothetical protein
LDVSHHGHQVLEGAVNAGCLELAEGGKRKEYRYRFLMLAKQIEVNLPSREEIATAMRET